MFDIFSSDTNDSNDSTDTETSIETETAPNGAPTIDEDVLTDSAQDIWGERGGPSELPDGADASVTPLSASSAQLLSNGGRVGSAYCKILYIPRGGWPANPEPGLLDRLTAHSSADSSVGSDSRDARRATRRSERDRNRSSRRESGRCGTGSRASRT